MSREGTSAPWRPGARRAASLDLRERGIRVGAQASKMKGKVKWFNTNRGFGFITVEGGRDVFVHYTAVSAPGRPRLREGQTVEFEIVQEKKGPRAVNVVPLD